MKSDVFTQKARDYALYRPQYAAEAIDSLINITGLDATWCVADIGAGTGNVSRHLVEKVNRVFAVEPENAMRHEAELLLNKHASFRGVAATAERTTLKDNSINLITIGQAIHWIDWEGAQKEFDRILKPDGWIALLWNQYETTHKFDIEYFFKPLTQVRRSYPVTFEEGWTEYLGGIRSASRNPSPGDYEYEEFEKKLKKKFDSQSKEGLITVNYTTELAAGRLNREQ